MARRSLVALLVVLALAGCGGSSKKSESTTTTTTESTSVSQAAWANSLCGSLLTWRNTLKTVGTTLQGGSLTKAKLQQAATTVSDANDKLATDVKDLGEPPKIAGPKVKSAVNNLSAQLKTSADQIRSAAKNITSLQDAISAATVASGALATMSAGISTAVTEMKSANVTESWKNAFANSASCKSLSQS